MSIALVITNASPNFEIDPYCIPGGTDTTMVVPIKHKEYNEVRIEMTRDRARAILIHLASRVGAIVDLGPKRITRATSDNLTSKYLGVCKIDARITKQWKAKLTHNGIRHARHFATEIEAARQYNEWVTATGAPRPLNVIPK